MSKVLNLFENLKYRCSSDFSLTEIPKDEQEAIDFLCNMYKKSNVILFANPREYFERRFNGDFIGCYDVAEYLITSTEFLNVGIVI